MMTPFQEPPFRIITFGNHVSRIITTGKLFSDLADVGDNFERVSGFVKTAKAEYFWILSVKRTTTASRKQFTYKKNRGQQQSVLKTLYKIIELLEEVREVLTSRGIYHLNLWRYFLNASKCQPTPMQYLKTT